MRSDPIIRALPGSAAGVLCLRRPSHSRPASSPRTASTCFPRRRKCRPGSSPRLRSASNCRCFRTPIRSSIYVQRLGQQLAAHAPGEKWPYTFHVVNQKEINAFALPGGPVFVNVGTIQAADNEAELAGVMAHEISHVVQRHGTRAASKQMAAQLPLAILGGVMGQGALSQMAQMGLSFGVGSYFLKNSRKSESEADLLGTDIMYDTGFNPRAMADFFAKIQEQGGSARPAVLQRPSRPGKSSTGGGEGGWHAAAQEQLSQRQRRVPRDQTAGGRHEAADGAADRGAPDAGLERICRRQCAAQHQPAQFQPPRFCDFLSRKLAGVRRPELGRDHRSARAECHRTPSPTV